MYPTQHMSIDNGFESAIKTGSRRKADSEFYRKLMKRVEWKDLLEEAYLIAPTEEIRNDEEGITPYKECGCSYPHHAIQNDSLILSIPRLKSAFVQTVESGDYFRNEEVRSHLQRHLEEAGLVSYKEVFESYVDGVYVFVLEMVKTWCRIYSAEEMIETADYLFEEIKRSRVAIDARRWRDTAESETFEASSLVENFRLADIVLWDYFSFGILLRNMPSKEDADDIYKCLMESGNEEIAGNFIDLYQRIEEGNI